MSLTETLAPNFDQFARERGRDYERAGRVRILRSDPTEAEAMVRGTRQYRVLVSWGADGVRVSCDCPRFETVPCKHLWETLVALERRRVGGGVLDAGPVSPPIAPWRARVGSILAARPESPASSGWPEGREILYEVDLAATLEGRGLAVGLLHRRRRKDGTWSRAVDRTHRIGQTRPVFAYRLVARGTVEEKVLALQATKRTLADAIVRADEGVLRGLRREDLELLLS
jgi:hypothetical protein